MTIWDTFDLAFVYTYMKCVLVYIHVCMDAYIYNVLLNRWPDDIIASGQSFDTPQILATLIFLIMTVALYLCSSNCLSLLWTCIVSVTLLTVSYFIRGAIFSIFFVLNGSFITYCILVCFYCSIVCHILFLSGQMPFKRLYCFNFLTLRISN